MHYTDSLVHSYEKRLCENVKDTIRGAEYNKLSDCMTVVYHSTPLDFELCFFENIIARNMFMNERVISVQFEDYRKSIEILDESFGFEPYYIDWSIDNKNPIMEKEYLETVDYREFFSGLEYRNIIYGDVLFDTLERGGNITFDEKRIVSKEGFCKACNQIIKSIDNAYAFFEKNGIKRIVLSEWGYTNGLFARVAQGFGVELYIANMMSPRFVARIDSKKKLYSDIKVDDICKRRCEYMPLYQYEYGDELFVYKREKCLTNILKTGDEHTCVFILAHALADNARNGSHMGVFYDYYEWLDFTLKTASQIKSVNWYLKDHPESRRYHQERIIKSLYDKYRSDNIIWCEKEISGEQIVELADCVVTCAGDAGIEYWSYGVPTISASDAYYVGWGISYSAKSKKEYAKLLKSVDTLRKPDEDSICFARRRLIQYCSKKHIQDGFERLLNDLRRRQLIEFTMSDGFSNQNKSFDYWFAQRIIDERCVNKYNNICIEVFDV